MVVVVVVPNFFCFLSEYSIEVEFVEDCQLMGSLSTNSIPVLCLWPH